MQLTSGRAHPRVVARPRLFWTGADGSSAMVTVGGILGGMVSYRVSAAPNHYRTSSISSTNGVPSRTKRIGTSVVSRRV